METVFNPKAHSYTKAREEKAIREIRTCLQLTESDQNIIQDF